MTSTELLFVFYSLTKTLGSLLICAAELSSCHSLDTCSTAEVFQETQLARGFLLATSNQLQVGVQIRVFRSNETETTKQRTHRRV